MYEKTVYDGDARSIRITTDSCQISKRVSRKNRKVRKSDIEQNIEVREKRNKWTVQSSCRRRVGGI